MEKFSTKYLWSWIQQCIKVIIHHDQMGCVIEIGYNTLTKWIIDTDELTNSQNSLMIKTTFNKTNIVKNIPQHNQSNVWLIQS